MSGHDDLIVEAPSVTLVEFLTARLDEDQEAAERAQPGPWIAVPAAMPGEVEIRHRMPDGRPDVAAAVATAHGLYCAASDAAHIARHDPARVLADVAAKRAMLPHLIVEGHPLTYCDRCQVLRHMAAVYAEHSGYRPEWRPPHE